MIVRRQSKGLRRATGPFVISALAGVLAAAAGCQAPPKPKRINGHDAANRSLNAEARCIRSAGEVDLRYEPILKAFCREVSQQDVVGASLAIAEAGEVRLEATTGDRCADGTDPVTNETAFGLGSLSKLVTAAIAYDLDNEGKVELDGPWRAPTSDPDPADPDQPDPQPTDSNKPDSDKPEPTLRQLLQHTAGIRWTLPSPALVQQLAEGPHYYPPGSLWNYSNEGYVLAGQALRDATGKDYPALVAELGIEGLVATGEGQEMACGHVKAPGQDTPVPTRLRVLSTQDDALLPAGGAIGTAKAVATLGLSLLGPRNAMVEAPAPTGEGDAYGLGIRIGETKEGRTAWHHSGNDGHYTADLYIVPAEELVVAVLASGDRPLRGSVAASLSELIDDGMYAAKVPAPKGDLSGDYFVAGFSEPAHLEAKGDSLVLDLPFLGIKGAILEQNDNGTYELRLPWGPPERLRFVNVEGTMALRGPRFVGFRRSQKNPPTQSEP